MLDSDDPDRIDHTLRQLAAVLPPAQTAELQQLLENFSFREAEAKVRQWLADAHD